MLPGGMPVGLRRGLLVGLVWLACLAGLTGCGDDVVPEPVPLAPLTPTTTVHPELDPSLEPAEAVLALVPSTAQTLTVTDLDAVRVQLGVPDLTGEDLMSDRSDFWARAEQEAPLLTQGLLRDHTSTLMLDHGFTQDDVDWEARWTGPEGSGFALAFRPGLDLDRVAEAVAAGVGPLARATVRRADRLVVAGAAERDEQVWANEPLWDGLLRQPATATYARRGCVPVLDALGPDAGEDDLAALRASSEVALLDDLPGFVVAFGDHLATVRVEEDRVDLFARLDVGDDWPDPAFAAAYRHPVGDPSSGRLGYSVPRPPQAAALALLEELPFAICPEVPSLPEPTG